MISTKQKQDVSWGKKLDMELGIDDTKHSQPVWSYHNGETRRAISFAGMSLGPLCSILARCLSEDTYRITTLEILTLIVALSMTALAWDVLGREVRSMNVVRWVEEMTEEMDYLLFTPNGVHFQLRKD